jgi:hypothetical protein
LSGGVPGQGVVVEGVKGVKCAPMPPRMYEKQKKGVFAHFLAYKSPKTPFFTQKYKTKLTPKMFFEEYIILTFFYLRHYGVLPV